MKVVNSDSIPDTCGKIVDCAYKAERAYLDIGTPSDWLFTDDDVQGYVSESNGRIIVSFRGTERSSIKDIATDLRVIPERIGCGAFAHRGAVHSMSKVWPRVLGYLRKKVAEPDLPKTPIDFTGHSLGGMIAQVFAYVWQSHGNRLGRVVLFGSPAAGSADLSLRIRTSAEMFVQVSHCADKVPRLWTPWLMGYRNDAAEHLYIDRQGGIVRNPSDIHRIQDRLTARWERWRQGKSGLALSIGHHSMRTYRNLIVENSHA